MDLQTISILSSISSLVVSVGAVALAIIFYMGGRNTELRITTALAEIRTHTDALQKLSGRQIDKLLKHALDLNKDDSNKKVTQQFIDVLSKLPNALTADLENLKQPASVDEQLLNTLYIVIYFYTAQTNYWVQYYLPKASDFDQQNQFHQLIKRIIDSSNDDFGHIAKILGSVDQPKLHQNLLSNLLKETKEDWRYFVKSTSDVFIETEKIK